MRSVTKAFLRYLPRRRSLSSVQIVGIACGVAAVIGMFFSARSALTSFMRTIEFVNGRATHSMERVAGPIEEDLLVRLMNDPDVTAFAPVIDRIVRLDSGDTIRLLGIDPFLDQSLRPRVLREEVQVPGTPDSLGRETVFSFILDENTCFLDAGTASRLGLHPGSSIKTSKGLLKILSVFPSPSPEPLLLIDIGHAQKLFGLAGRVDRIDLILKNEKPFLLRYDHGFRIESARQKEQIYSGMLSAFRLNLEALSLIALFVGVFLIYNTTTFNVISRRKDAGILRSLGASRIEIAGAFLAEMFLLGLAGGILGGLLGFLLSRFLTILVGQTISNLYFFLRPVPLPWSWGIIGAGVLLGCSASLLGGLFPLLHLIRSDVVVILQGRTVLKKSSGARRIAVAGIFTLLITASLLVLSFLHVYVGFAAAFAFLLGTSLLTGLFLAVVGSPLKALFAFFGGLPGRIAIGNIRQNLGRTGVATAAFMVALSMSIALGAMIGSFRNSLVWWMGTQLKADLYIGSTSEGVEVPEALYDELKSMPMLGGVDPYRNVQMMYRGRLITVAAVSAAVLEKYTQFGWLAGGNENWEKVKKGEVLVSESFARTFKVDRKDRIILEGLKGPVAFVIAAVFYDYTTEHGLIMMDRSTYLASFGDHTINSVGIFLDPKDPEEARLLETVKNRAVAYHLPVFTLAELRGRILSVFDSTFAVTNSMRILAIVVAFFGIAGALLTLFIERQKEFGVYRALGVSTRQVAAMTVLEGLGMGLVSFGGSILVGTILAVILIKVINLRSFNWTIFYYPALSPYVVAGITAVLASLAASLYPLWRIMTTYPYIQMREE